MRPIALLLMLLTSTAVMSRPISYVGGWTFIEESNRQSTSALLHYTPTPNWSLGGRTEWFRDDDYLISSIQSTYLLKRWFGQDYQANVYLQGGLGLASGYSGNPLDSTGAAYAGVIADWETRRLFLGYNARYVEAGHFGDNAMQLIRMGWAPYEGDTQDLHTWLMVEIDHRPESKDPVSVTPLVRFFQGSVLLELGFNIVDPAPLINFTYRF